MRPPSALRAAGLAAAALLLPACLEADVQTELRKDGTGQLGVSMKFSEKFVEVAKRIQKVDPANTTFKEARGGLLEKPSDEILARWEKAGLKVSECVAVDTEKELSMRLKVEFQALDRLRLLEEAQQGKGKSPAGAFTLTRDDQGVYTLAMVSDEDEGGEIALEEPPAPAKEEEKPAVEEDPEVARKKQAEAMAAAMELMAELNKFKFTVSMKVPGEIVDFAPAAAAKKEEGKVTWTFTFESMMEAEMAGMGDEDAGGMDSFRVRFRMPAGESLPASALWAGPEKKKEAPPAGAPAEPKAPEGGK
jgi:hypothetical protein